MVLSLRPHGLLLNDSEVTIPGDSDMIHVVFCQAKFVSNTHHFASYAGAPATHRCACSCDTSVKKTSSISLFPQNDRWEMEPLFCSCFNAVKLFSNDFKRVPRHAPHSSHPMSAGQFVSATTSQQECVKLVGCLCVCSLFFALMHEAVLPCLCVYAFSLWASHEHRLGSCEEHHVIAIS